MDGHSTLNTYNFTNVICLPNTVALNFDFDF